MIEKIIGSVLVIGSSTLIGIQKGNKFKHRVELLKEFRNSIQMLETEINYGANPLPCAFKNISEKVGYPLSDFYEYLSDGLGKGEFNSIHEAIGRVSDYVFIDRGLAFDKSDVGLIKSLGNILGTSDREDQVKHLRLFNVQLEQQIDKAEEARKSNENIYKNMGFIIGMGISLVLV